MTIPPKPTIRELKELDEAMRQAFDDIKSGKYNCKACGAVPGTQHKKNCQWLKKQRLSPQTGEGEKGYLETIKTEKCPHGIPLFQTCRECGRLTINEEPFEKGIKYATEHPNPISEEMEWEKEWDKLHPNMVGLAVEKTEKAFLRKHLSMQREEMERKMATAQYEITQYAITQGWSRQQLQVIHDALNKVIEIKDIRKRLKIT